MRRHDLLESLHQQLRPRSYLEIGVSTGLSMELSRTRSIGVDPFFKIKREVRCDLHLVRATSDEFFAREHPLAHFDEPVADLVFIDGMHLAEYALRDYLNAERYSHGATVIVLDDMLPRHPDEASRDRAPGRIRRSWTGDVYKVLDVLRQHRPDLVVLEVDTLPTGTAVVLLPDAGSTTWRDVYDDVVDELVTPDPQPVPAEVLDRSRAHDGATLLTLPLWAELRDLRATHGTDPVALRAAAAEAVDRSGLRTR